jgi:hypothetical protein
MNNEWKITSEHGVFRLKVANGDVSIGGKDTCVLIVYDGPEKSMLQWFGTKVQCELRGFPVQGETTKHMVYLATTVFRSLHRDVKYLNILDSSSYKCKLNNGATGSIILREANFLFHGKTYYEQAFQAVPSTTDGEQRMTEFRKALHDPSKKPATFRFIDNALTTELTPLYNSTSTWWDFFQSIQSKWKNKCAWIHPWYRFALNEMVKDTIPEHWKIDITKFPLLRPKFEPLSSIKGGSRKRTRKNSRESQSVEYYPITDEPWDISTYFRFY